VIQKIGIDLPIMKWAEEEGVAQTDIRERIEQASDAHMAEKTAAFGADTMRNIEKQILLQTIDSKWREHLLTLEHLRSVVGFRGYAQRDPLNEYKTEAFQLFEGLLDGLREEVTKQLARIRPLSEEEQREMLAQMAAQHAQAQQSAEPQVDGAAEVTAEGEPVNGFDPDDPATWGNPGRNDKCPCGSGNKFKHCHG